MSLHVHGETTITLGSGRVLCNCGYERLEFEGGLVGWGIAGANPADPDDREVVETRRMIWNKELIA